MQEKSKNQKLKECEKDGQIQVQEKSKNQKFKECEKDGQIQVQENDIKTFKDDHSIKDESFNLCRYVFDVSI